MGQEKNDINLKDKWNNFFNVIFDPWVLFLLILTIIFIVYSSTTDDKNVLAILTLVITLLAGLLGGIISNRWAQMTELKVLVARGKSAIRSLKLILLNINNIEKRTKDYIDCLDKENKEHKLISNNFQEVIEKCNILEEEIVSSIENWTDIIPEVANIKTQIGLVSEMKETQMQLYSDIEKLTHEIQTVKEKEGEQKEKLKDQLKQKEEALKGTREKLRAAEQKIDNTVLSGLTFSTGSLGASLYSNQKKTCSKCGKEYSPTSLYFDNLCNSCRSVNVAITGGISLHK